MMYRFVSLTQRLFLVFSFAMTLLLSNCGADKKESAPTLSVKDKADISLGFQLLESNCFSCHSPDADFNNRVAPPMIAIKKHYIDSDVTLEQFTSELLAFTNNPSEETSKMPGAIKRFGLMPKMSFSEDQVRKIAKYIYYTEIEAPSWFQKHYEEERKKHGGAALSEDLSDVDLGRKYALSTKAVLGKNLMAAIQKYGTEGAVTFCNTKAYPLTDSMALALNVSIKRVSDQPRNPLNTANEKELAFIKDAKALLGKGQKIMPQMQEINGKAVGYYPIKTNKMCLQCHGTANTDVLAPTLEKIAALYPKDQALGYDENELRGIWVVEMDKKETEK